MIDPSPGDLGLLLRYGADCIGAVGVRPETEPANAGTAGETIAAGRTLSGVQRKLPVRQVVSQFEI